MSYDQNKLINSINKNDATWASQIVILTDAIAALELVATSIAEGMTTQEVDDAQDAVFAVEATLTALIASIEAELPLNPTLEEVG